MLLLETIDLRRMFLTAERFLLSIGMPLEFVSLVSVILTSAWDLSLHFTVPSEPCSRLSMSELFKYHRLR
jgi:hypothetical protein